MTPKNLAGTDDTNNPATTAHVLTDAAFTRLRVLVDSTYQRDNERLEEMRALLDSAVPEALPKLLISVVGGMLRSVIGTHACPVMIMDYDCDYEVADELSEEDRSEPGLAIVESPPKIAEIPVNNNDTVFAYVNTQLADVDVATCNKRFARLAATNGMKC